MSFRSYLKSPVFRKTMLRIVLLYVAVVALVWFFLHCYTEHGSYISVPDLKGKPLSEAMTSLDDRDLTYLVIDSIYDKKATPGTVLEQSPSPESQVKQGRQVFLTIYSYNAPMEKLGIREGDFATVAFVKLKNKGIEFDTLYVANNTFPGSIISVSYKGRKIGPDHLVAKGDKVILSIGRAVTSKIIVPDFTGLTCPEAEAIMDTLNLFCNCLFDGINQPTTQDSSTFRVCAQDPVHDPVMGTSPGRTIDLWLYATPCLADTTSSDR
ncbi:MAG: PASTA domain-containing protein [Flavobacteriales bacterium]